MMIVRKVIAELREGAVRQSVETRFQLIEERNGEKERVCACVN